VDNENSASFMDLLKQLSVPASALLYLLAFITQLREYAAGLGWLIVFVAVLLLAVAWCAYTWTAKEKTTVEPSQLKRKHGTWARWGAIASVVLVLVPLAYLFRFEIISLRMAIRLENSTEKEISVSRFGEFYLTKQETPGSHVQVENGRIVLIERDENDSDYISVPSGSTKSVFGEFSKSKRIYPFLAKGDYAVDFNIHQKDGQSLLHQNARFSHENLEKRYLLLELKGPQ